MGIKSYVKFSFIVIAIIISIIGVVNFALLYQINENNSTKKDIDTLIYMQENMHELLKELSTIKDTKLLQSYQKEFNRFEHTFEEIEDRHKKMEQNDLFDIFITDINSDNEVKKRLNLLFSYEIKVEKAFEKIYKLQTEQIILQNKFNTIYPKESNLRKSIGQDIEKLKDYTLTRIYADIKYYSKETLYQYRNIETLTMWIEKVSKLQKIYTSQKLDQYSQIVKDIGSYSIRLKEIDMEKEHLKNGIRDIINKNKKHSLYISKKIENRSSGFINFAYYTIISFIIAILIFIITFGYRIYKNVGLSVDEIEEKIQLGLKEIKELNNEIEVTQREVVFTMGAIGESRSKETGNHVKRVAEYSKLLALYYGLPKQEAEMLKQASPMHDIGKIAIPDSILNKPGRFNDDEREIMNTHAKLGFDMLKNSQRPLLKMAATVAHEHHEKWDGTGYPKGLKGEDIHIYGRITALADVFDALGSERVYKKAWDDEKIFKLFKEERGKHFDPKLVDIFFDNLDEFLKIRDTFKDK
jgi:HD-GYP domain-containing protein (c-di-GMP phosphodiesterase class II)